MGLKRVLAVILGLGLAGAAWADVPPTPFELRTPYGTSINDFGAPIAELDWLPGSGLAVGANTNGPGGAASPFEFLYQLRLGSIIDVNGDAVPTAVLNGTVKGNQYEFTAVGRIWELATPAGASNISYTMTDDPTGNKPNVLKVYADTYAGGTQQANPATGTGFTDGTLVLVAHPIFVVSNVQYGDTNKNGVVDNQDYSSGSTQVIFQVDFYDPNYFTFPWTTSALYVKTQFEGTVNTPPDGVRTVGMWDGTVPNYYTPTAPTTTPYNTRDVLVKIDGNSRFGPRTCTGSIGDFIWHDLNRNGIQDAGEPGIDGVTVNLYDSSNNLIATTTTGVGPLNQHGYYQFTGVCAGDYTVEAVTPSGFSPTTSGVGSDRTTDSNGSPAPVTLPTDDSSDQTIDFGYVSSCTGSIGDFLWHDLNRNGIQDAGEPGIDGVTVNLYDSSNNLIATTTTGVGPLNQRGYYQFTGLCAGSYTVEAVTPSGFLPTTSGVGSDRTIDSNGSPAPVTLPTDDSSDQTIDFGYVSPCTGSIGDFLWHDLNRNGIQDAGEPGINGVTMNLYDSSNSLVATTTTGVGPLNQNGYYQFTGLCAGSYTVEASTPSGFSPTTSGVGSDRTIDSNGSPAPVTLPTDDFSDQTIDFGYVSPCTGSIGDFLWHDLNRNGIQDAGEPGINGVTVNLYDSSNSLVATTTTGVGPLNQNGYYQFTGLCAGSYTVEASTPSGFSPTTSGVGSDRTIDSNGSPAPVTLPTDDSSDQTIDFGYVSPCTGSIGDFLWHDLNRNGIQDAGEPGIDGVTVNLYDSSNTLLATTTSGPNGYYQFTGLCAGDYTVTAVTPSGFSPTTNGVGSDRTIDSNGSPAPVTLLADNSSDQTIDFGYVSPCTGSIGDFLWHDLNRNGIQDAGEPGIDGATVNLLDAANTLLATTTSGPNGYYQFTGLCAGDYTVTAVTPSGFSPTASGVGSDRSIDSNGSPAPVTLLTDSASDQTIDFGYVSPCAGAIGDFIWNDLNADGIQDQGEPGIDGATVNLYNTSHQLIATTTSGPNGYYQFTGLCAGDYTVEVVTPSGFFPTKTGAGSNTALDSNGSPAVVTLPIDGSDQTIDFGFVRAAPCIRVTKTCVDASAPEQPITFSGMVTNCGNVALLDVTVVDDKSGATVALGTLAAGDSAPYAGSYVPNETPSTDTVTASGTDAVSGATVTAQASATCHIVTAPKVSVTKSCTAASAPGEPIHFSAVVTNSGNEMLTNISCADDPATTLTGVPASLAPGASATVTGSYVPSSSPSTDTLTCGGKGQISATTVSDKASATCKINTLTDMTVTKSCTDASAPGQPISFSAVVKNTGNETLTAISCTDDPATTLTGVPASLAPGALATVTGSYVPSSSPSTDTLTCKGTGSISGVSITKSGSATCKVQTHPCIKVTKSCTDVPAGTSSASCPTPAPAIDFSGTVTNCGDVPLSSVTVVDLVDGKTTTVLTLTTPLAAGASANYSGRYTPTTSPSTDTVTASGTYGGATYKATASATCNLPPPPSPCIKVTKSCTDVLATSSATGASCPTPGPAIDFTGTVTNCGNVPLSNITVVDLVDGKTTTVLTLTTPLAAGASANYSGRYTPTTSPSTDTVTASGTYGGATYKATASATCNLPPPPSPCIKVTKSCTDVLATSSATGASCPTPGPAIDFTGTVTNCGNVPLSNITVVDLVDGKTTTVLTLTTPLAAGASANYSGRYTPTTSPSTDTVTASGIYGGATYKATASATCNLPPPPAPSIKIIKKTNGVEADNPNAPGVPQLAYLSAVTWTYEVTNTGNVALTNVKVVDDQGVAVTCPKTGLAVGETMTCTGSGTAADLKNTLFHTVPGLCGGVSNSLIYENVGTATGNYNGIAVTAKDVSHYCNPPTSGGNLGAGDTATIGFWHNKNGQALINSLNGGSSSTKLATWLATQFPYLYGANAGANNLTGKKNSDVAALFLKFFNVTGAKVDAQVLAGALAVYVTNSTLAGTVAKSYGFNVTSTGTGAKTYNTGSNGTAIGLANNTNYTIVQLLQQANLRKKAGTFDANAFNNIFDGINQKGDIV